MSDRPHSKLTGVAQRVADVPRVWMNVVFMVFGGACGVLANIALEASSPSLSGKFGVVVFSIVLLSGLAAWRFGWVRERSRTLVVALAYLIVLVDMNAQGNRITI